MGLPLRLELLGFFKGVVDEAHGDKF